jgi:hypothetical protein
MKNRTWLPLALMGAALLGASLTPPVRKRVTNLVTRERRGRPRLVGFAPHPGGDGGWGLDRRGNIFAFGNAPEFREVPEPVPWRQASFVGLAATPSGQGLWVLDRRGNIFSYGDAPEFREIPEPEPWRQHRFVSIASTPTGRGVWVMDSAGNVFSFGDAAELGAGRS